METIIITPYDTVVVDEERHAFQANIVRDEKLKGRGYGFPETQAIQNAHRNALHNAKREVCKITPVDPEFVSWIVESLAPAN